MRISYGFTCSTADGIMKPGAKARGALKPPVTVFSFKKLKVRMLYPFPEVKPDDYWLVRQIMQV